MLAELIRDLRDQDASLVMLGPALVELRGSADARDALLAVVGDSNITTQHTLDALSSSDDPVVRAETARVVADVFDLDGRPEDALALLRMVIDELEGSDVPSPALQVDLLLELSELAGFEDREEARASLERALALARGHAETHGRVGEIEALLDLELAHTGAWKEAVDRATSSRIEAERDIDWLSKLVADSPEPWMFHDLGRAELRAGLYQAALDSAGQGLALAVDLPLLLLCADICNQIAEYEAASDYARAAIAREPTDAGAYSRLALALQHVPGSRGEHCEAAFEQVLALAGEERTTRLYALKGRAGARRALGREAEARVDYESVLAALEPEDDPWLEGWAHYNLGHYEDAATAYEQALAVDASRVNARFDLALAHAVAGRRTRSICIARPLPRWTSASRGAGSPSSRSARQTEGCRSLVRPQLLSEPAFREIVEAVEDRLKEAKSLLDEPFLPKIPEDSA